MQKFETNLTRSEAINLLQSAMGMHLSNEQLAILSRPEKRPTLINACAGSGKTTIFMLSAMVMILTGEAFPEDILGITFSKKAQLEMVNRYRQYVKKLKLVGIDLSDCGRPHFSTFHAPFYRLLRKTPDFNQSQVLSSYKQFTSILSRSIKRTRSQVNSTAEILDEMFELADFLINRGISTSAFSELTMANQLRDQLQEIGEDNYDLNFYTDYLNVMNQYVALKRQKGLIDFNDMKILLYDLLDEDDYLTFFRQSMAHFKWVVLDEFQDIDDLQWQIMMRLLSEPARQQLLAIGDDDQSIYAFRGSNPAFILKFPTYLTNSQTYHLSTNYRTGGRILSEAKPLIEHNYVRLVKKLKAVKPDAGQVCVYPLKTAGFDVTSDMFKKLVTQIKDPKVDNRQLAVLVRYNSDRTLVADWLANQGIYVNINNRGAIFQNTLVYRTLIGLMRAIWQDQFSDFYNQATRVGFTAYKRHVSEINKAAGGFVAFSDYLQIVTGYNQRYSRTAQEKQFAEIDAQLNKTFQAIHHIQKYIRSDLNSEFFSVDKETYTRVITELWQTVIELTDAYFDYMTQNDYLSKAAFNDMTSYLSRELETVTDLDDWFITEDQKCRELTDKILNGTYIGGDVQFLSLHQAKGLEFQDVYLYGLSDKQLPAGTLIINDWFHPDLTFEGFIKRWRVLAGQVKQIKDLTGVLEAAFIEETHEVKSNKRIDLKNLQFEGYHEEDLALLDSWYNSIRHYSQFIEEERRLVYVGMTRAKRTLNVSVAKNASPLLRQVPVVKRALEKERKKQQHTSENS